MLLREAIGVTLRSARKARGETLRDVCSRACVALGYLSEVERGRKDASSEVLAAVAGALELPVPVMLADAAQLLHTTQARAARAAAGLRPAA